MKRDGTVGRSDAIERSLPSHRDIDPARVMRPRFAEPIRASSPSGLHQRAGHMTASDNCSTPNKISCGAGAIHTGLEGMTRMRMTVSLLAATMLTATIGIAAAQTPSTTTAPGASSSGTVRCWDPVTKQVRSSGSSTSPSASGSSTSPSTSSSSTSAGSSSSATRPPEAAGLPDCRS